MTVIRTGAVIRFKTDAAAVIGKLDSVTEDIYQYFPNPYRICQHIGILRFCSDDRECQITIDKKSVGNIQYFICNRGG